MTIVDTRRRLPSLTALRNFEAVARHLSFTRAADELCVTQAAVSHQVRALEDELGKKLLVRLPQRIELTESGRDLYEVARVCFNQIAVAANRIRDDGRLNRLRINVTPLFSSRWLVPRLSSFIFSHPEIELTLHHTFEAPDPNDQEVDATIAYGYGDWAGFIADYLISADLVPLCSPVVLGDRKLPMAIEELSGFTLLHEFSHQWWEDWISKTSARSVSVRRGLVFDDPNVLINAAVQGNGVFLGAPLHVQDLIAEGKLVAPFGFSPSIAIDYYLLRRPELAQSKSIGVFRNWLLREASSFTVQHELDSKGILRERLHTTAHVQSRSTA